MSAILFLEHDNYSFSKLLLSKEVADIIKHVVQESAMIIHLSCNDRKKNKGENCVRKAKILIVQNIGLNKKSRYLYSKFTTKLPQNSLFYE